MEEKFKELAEKAGDIAIKVEKFFESINEKIYETSGKKVNVGVYVIGGVLIVFALIFAISILKWLRTFL